MLKLLKNLYSKLTVIFQKLQNLFHVFFPESVKCLLVTVKPYCKYWVEKRFSEERKRRRKVRGKKALIRMLNTF